MLSGLFSRIKTHLPYERIFIEHIGVVHNRSVDTTSEEVRKWWPAFENYTFVEEGVYTEVQIDLQADPEYAETFSKICPKALY